MQKMEPKKIEATALTEGQTKRFGSGLSTRVKMMRRTRISQRELGLVKDLKAKETVKVMVIMTTKKKKVKMKRTKRGKRKNRMMQKKDKMMRKMRKVVRDPRMIESRRKKRILTRKKNIIH